MPGHGNQHVPYELTFEKPKDREFVCGAWNQCARKDGAHWFAASVKRSNPGDVGQHLQE